MNIIIKGTGFDLTPSIKTYIEDKLSPLARFIGKYDLEGAVELRVEIGRTTRHHKHGEVYRAEMNLVLPGAMLRAEDENEDVRKAVDAAKKKLRNEIDRFKTKAGDKRKGARK